MQDRDTIGHLSRQMGKKRRDGSLHINFNHSSATFVGTQQATIPRLRFNGYHLTPTPFPPSPPTSPQDSS